MYLKTTKPKITCDWAFVEVSPTSKRFICWFHFDHVVYDPQNPVVNPLYTVPNLVLPNGEECRAPENNRFIN